MVSSPPSTADALAHLPPYTNKYPYRSFHDFRSVLSYEAKRLQEDPKSSQFILFTHLAPITFNSDFEEPIRDIICHTIDSYSPKQEELVLKMKTGAHEAAHSAFDKLLIEKLAFMKLADRKLLGVGAKTIHATSRSKEADQTYRPLDLPHGRTIDWPTLVIESGYIASAETPRNNASWWLTASAGDVKVVVTIDIDKRNRQVSFRKHYRLGDDSLHEQLVSVTPADVSGSPMVFAFHHLFLTHPTADESDIEFTRADFEYMAESIWKEQFR